MASLHACLGFLIFCMQQQHSARPLGTHVQPAWQGQGHPDPAGPSPAAGAGRREETLHHCDGG